MPVFERKFFPKGKTKNPNRNSFVKTSQRRYKEDMSKKLNWSELEKVCLKQGFVKEDFIGLVKDISPSSEQLASMIRGISDRDVFSALLESQNDNFSSEHRALIKERSKAH
jgi:hypothetical protein